MERIAFFEDQQEVHLRPLTWLRPTFELRCGHFSPRERAQEIWTLREWGAFLRPELADVYREELQPTAVNDWDWLRQAPTWLINGRWHGDLRGLADVTEDCALIDGTSLVAVQVFPHEVPEEAPDDFETWLQSLVARRATLGREGALIKFPWHLVERNPEQLTNDFHARPRRDGASSLDRHVAIVGSREDVMIDPTAEVDPFVVIDARHGPVWIEAGVKVQAFTRLEGPCFIGRETRLFRANVREGCSIGEVCRVGGEIEESIIHGFSNKYHDGFLGHAYVCPWVNLGALTTNSDLKNDYSHVRVPLAGGEVVDSGSTKVGCFVGDHTKTALCSLFNTGSVIGVMDLVLPGGGLLPKRMPSFTRYWNGVLEELPDGTESGIASARTAMARRDKELTPAGERLLRWVFEASADDRAACIARDQARRQKLG